MIKRNTLPSTGCIGGVIFALTFFASHTAIAQEHGTAPAPAAHSTPDVHSTAVHAVEEARPVLPADASAWAGTMLIIIVAMFLMAAVIGPMVRIEIPVDSHDVHGHDDHGHGHDDHGHRH